MMLTQIDHVGIAVPDLGEAVERYRRTFDIEPVHRERMADQGVEEVLFAVGESFVQLIGALGPDTPVGAMYVALLPMMIGMAVTMSPFTTMIMTSVPPERLMIGSLEPPTSRWNQR